MDAVCDKAFVVPCWIFLMSTVPGSSRLWTLQYVTLWCLVLAETASGCIRFRAFFTASGVPAPTVEDLDFSTSAVKVRGVCMNRAFRSFKLREAANSSFLF